MSRPMHAALTAALIFAASAVRANDSSFGGYGSQVINIREQRIRMAREHILIVPVEPAADRQKRGRWHATCDFDFENVSAETVKVQMGFPDWWRYSEDPGDKWSIRNFTVSAGGLPLKPEHKEVVRPDGTVSTDPLGAREIGYQAAFLWDMEFKPGQKISVRNEYDFDGFVTLTAVNDLFRSKGLFGHLGDKVFWQLPPRKTWEKLWADPEAKVQTVLPVVPWDWGNSMYQRVSYIVATGKSWKQPIGAARIEIRLPAGTLPYQVLIAPGGYSFDGDAIVWERRDWVPDSDLDIILIRPFQPENDEAPLGVFNTLAEAKSWAGILEKNRIAPRVYRRAWQAYLANAGAAIDDDLEAQAFFAENPDYQAYRKRAPKPRPLTGREQKIVDFLREREQSVQRTSPDQSVQKP